ncbi:hypothetical protein N9B60_02915 [Mariniblastus sp.]|nr:hypothetical protein [bacterium]MDA7924328.1 hypothetical protein [Mariniblastus sp.]
MSQIKITFSASLYRPAAADRLAHLGNRPQFISQENSIEARQTYLKEAHPANI